MERKLVVLGIPWEVNTEGLREYMSKFGELEDCIVMKERSTGRSRGFGYVTFVTEEDAKNALSGEHILGNRMLEVKVATPKEEMRQPARKATRIFVARIPQSVTKTTFQSHFEKYGEITDIYMPKDQGAKNHRGIGFITFASSDSVDNLMGDTHELGGSTVAVDRATPKEDDFRPTGRTNFRPIGRTNFRPMGRAAEGGYGAYNSYISAATRYAVLGAPTLYDHTGPVYGRGELSQGLGKKIFVGRLSQEATAEDLRQYFSRFGRILDVYIPKDPKRTGHRGFGFVTFAEDGVADRVSRRSHEICGQQVAIDTATPLDDAGPSESLMMNPPEPFGGYGGSMRTYGRMYGSLDFDDWGYGMGSGRPSRADWRHIRTACRVTFHLTKQCSESEFFILQMRSKECKECPTPCASERPWSSCAKQKFTVHTASAVKQCRSNPKRIGLWKENILGSRENETSSFFIAASAFATCKFSQAVISASFLSNLQCRPKCIPDVKSSTTGLRMTCTILNKTYFENSIAASARSKDEVLTSVSFS